MFRVLFTTILILVKSVNSEEELLLPVDELYRERHVLSTILNLFQDYNIIFHATNNTINFVNNAIGLLEQNNEILARIQTVYIFNHDTLKINDNFIRPPVSKSLVVLFSLNQQLWKLLGNVTQVNSNDVVIFIGQNIRAEILAHAEEILKLVGLVIAIERNDTDISIYKTCYYCGKMSQIFEVIAKSDNSEITSNLEMFQPNNFKDLNGHLLKAAFVQYYPFLYCNKKLFSRLFQYQNMSKLHGIESKFIQTMSEKLNFKYSVQNLDTNTSFFQMILYVNAKNADFAFGGISVTTERIPLVQFSQQYNFEDYIFLFVLQLELKDIFERTVEPFHHYVAWCLFVACIFVFSFLIHAFLKVYKVDEMKNRSVGYVLWVFIHMPFEQSASRIDRVFEGRGSNALVLALWWWTCLIFCTLYKSSLLSSLVNAPNLEPNNLEQLVRAGYRIAGNLQYADIIKELLHVNDPIYAEALRNTIYGDDACDVMSKIFDGKVALIDERSEVQYELRTICPTPPNQISDNFRVARNALRATGHAWALQKGAPYFQAFDYYIGLILSGGLFKKWKSDVTSRLASNLIQESRGDKEKKSQYLTLVRMIPMLSIYLVGIAFATICLFFEMLFYRVKTRRRNIVTQRAK